MNYIWNGVVFLNLKTAPDIETINFYPGMVEGIATDVGGHIHYYLTAHPNIRNKHLPCTSIIKREHTRNFLLIPEEGRQTYVDSYRVEMVTKAILHYRAGSNWDNQKDDYVKAKSSWLFGLLEALLVKKEDKNDLQ